MGCEGCNEKAGAEQVEMPSGNVVLKFIAGQVEADVFDLEEALRKLYAEMHAAGAEVSQYDYREKIRAFMKERFGIELTKGEVEGLLIKIPGVIAAKKKGWLDDITSSLKSPAFTGSTPSDLDD